MMLWNLMIEPLRAPVLFAILHRLNGDGVEAERLLRNVLERVKAEPIQGINGMGFTRFTIHAFLGESEAAIAELEAAVKAGWGLGWWGLKDGGFDPNYAAVVADPRFVKLYGEIEARVKKTREDFFAHPELPEASQIP
jgi:hypothetical protein